MTQKEREDVGRAFLVAGKWLALHGGQVAAVLMVMAIIGQPHFKAWAQGIMIELVADEVRKDCVLSPMSPDYNPHSLACANAKQAEELAEVKENLATVAGAVEANSRAITGVEGKVDSAIQESRDQYNTIIELLSPPTPN
jgi:hypothetical protein